MKPVSEYIDAAEAALLKAEQTPPEDWEHGFFMNQAIVNASLASATATLLAAGVIQ